MGKLDQVNEVEGVQLNKNLSKQVFIYSVSTDNFMTDEENEIHSQKQGLEFAKTKHIEELKKLEKKKMLTQEVIDDYLLKRNEIKNDKYNKYVIDYFLFCVDANIENEIFKILLNGGNKKELNKKKNELFNPVNERIEKLKLVLKDLLDENKDIVRTIRNDAFNENNLISQFESALIRTLKVPEEETTTDIIMIRAYHYSIFKSLVEKGFNTASGDVYQYFTSSAGAIRNKKSMFIKGKVLENIENTLFAGLTVDEINKRGGMNINKWNAYTALTMTASIPWTKYDDGSKFSIHNCIVVDDFETIVHGVVDHISSDYEIARGEKPITIPHMDGAGIMLPSVSKKAMQIRMPYFKGLLIPTPYDVFLEKHKDASAVVKDIYGKEWNILEDKISIIFTKSQFKAWKMVINEDNKEDSWNDYKKAFEEYCCEASICNEEKDEHDDKTLCYQMLQTLYSMTDDELNDIASRTANDIAKMGNDYDVIMSSLGVTDENENKNSFQQALEIYPNLLNDVHSKEIIRETQKSMIKRANAGKLLMDGNRRTFIAPDVYAFMEWLFMGIEKPDGLLADGEVSCRLYDDGEELLVLRSPHLYIEHSVNTNLINEKIETYFMSDCVYTSTHSLISKLLMFDVDGDEALIVNSKSMVYRAKEQMKDIVPLSYELGTAKAQEITRKNIYTSLIAAYEKNIGEYSNKITKVFNNGKINEDALKVVKWLTYENNACIDFAKSLWFPERPPHVDKMIKDCTKGKLPYFFTSAKDKPKSKVEKINSSVVNRLQKNKIIQSTRKHIIFEDVVEPFDYTKLLYNNSIDIETDLAKEIIEAYDKWNKNKHWQIKKQAKAQDKSVKKVKFHVIKKIRNQLREIKNDDIYITDVLVKYLFEKEAKNKNLLWDAFGDVIVWNLKRNVKNVVECLDCGSDVKKTKQRQDRCPECQTKRNKKLERIRKQKERASKKVS